MAAPIPASSTLRRTAVTSSGMASKPRPALHGAAQRRFLDQQG